MSIAAELRRQVESALKDRIPAALSFRPLISPELLSCGLEEVDTVLSGGLPLGAITELTGTHSSGRTSLVLSTLAGVTQQGGICAYVDTSDALNPVSASAHGVDLHRLLWVRVGEADVAERASFSAAMPAPMPAQAVESTLPGGAGWCHPRHEAIGLPNAVGELFQTVPKENVGFTPRCSEAMRRERVQPVVFAPFPRNQPVPHPRTVRKKKTTWTRLDHALRAADLLLSAGGFRALVLDMADVPPEQARRVSLATWYRFRLQAEKSRTLFLLMTSVACANCCAAVSLHCQQGDIDWQQASLNSPRLLAGLRYHVSVEGSRVVDQARKKPSSSAEASWSSATTWSR